MELKCKDFHIYQEKICNILVYDKMAIYFTTIFGTFVKQQKNVCAMGYYFNKNYYQFGITEYELPGLSKIIWSYL